MTSLVIAVEDPRIDDVRALLERHLAFAREVTPPGHVHALDIDALLDPDVTLFTMRRDGQLVGCGALKQLDGSHVELKSMHVAAEARGEGLGRALVSHMLAVAAERGYERVSLETGTYDAFAPAQALYTSLGFVPCPPFAQYTDNPYSQCFTRLVRHTR